jgi:nicotinamide riboside transporter PnuC
MWKPNYNRVFWSAYLVAASMLASTALQQEHSHEWLLAITNFVISVYMFYTAMGAMRIEKD